MNIDRDFQNRFGYDHNTDCYFATGNHNEVILYQVGNDFIVTTYIEERAERSYFGDDLDEAIRVAVDKHEAYIAPLV